MPEPGTHIGLKLTRHTMMAPLYFGRTARDWFKFYGLIAGLWFFVALVYTRHFELFDDIESKSAEYQSFVMWFAGLPLLIVLPAVLGFLWWAAGALVRYARWQERNTLFWRWFWLAVLVFYVVVEFDPLDAIHPVMSSQGLGPAPNLLKLFDGKFEMFQFQWGYFLLWFLFWFLVFVAHASYIADGWRTVWFYICRFHRYGASVLTGFSTTAATLRRQPVTMDYPRRHAELPETFRGVPQLNVPGITSEQARAIIAADASGAITAAPGQPTVLFVDLGRFDWSPGLAELADEHSTPLLRFTDRWAEPAVSREELVVPLMSAGLATEPGGEG